MMKPLEQLEGNEVISVNQEDRISVLNTTFTVDEFLQQVQSYLSSLLNKAVKQWLFEGVDCKVLSPGKPWRAGKLRISIIFEPDNPETEETPGDNSLESAESELPIDDIRR